MEMGKEVKLCLTLINHGDEIPAGIKDAALEELRVLAMHYDADAAELYIIERIIEAVENEDAEALSKAAAITRVVMCGEDIRTNAADKAVEELSDMAMEAVGKFVDEANEADERDVKIRKAVMTKLTEQGIMPMFYEQGFMVMFAVEDGVFILISVNDAYEDKHVLKDIFEAMPGRVELLNKVREITGSSHFEILFGRLNYKAAGDGIVSVLLEEM